MHKCIPYAKSGALPLNEPGRLLERAECINAFPTKDPCKFQFDGAFRPVTFLPGYVERKNIGHHRRASHPPYEHAETFSVQRNMDGNRSFGTDESVPYEHAGTYPVQRAKDGNQPFGTDESVPYKHAGTYPVQRNMDGNQPFGTDESVPYEHAGTFFIQQTLQIPINLSTV